MAGLLPQGFLQFLDSNGDPLAGGSVGYYDPSAPASVKAIWADASGTVPLQNPIPLDAAGRPFSGGSEVGIYGSGEYQMMVRSFNGTLQWSALTYAALMLSDIPAPPVIPPTPPSINFPTIAALRANATAVPPLAEVINVEGYYAIGDGGGGSFIHNIGDHTNADNAGTVIVDTLGQRWWRINNSDSFNILWFGGRAADSAPALNAALTALPAHGGEIIFPPGKYTFQSVISFVFPAVSPFSVSLVGAGENATTLYWPNSNGIAFFTAVTQHTVRMRDFTVATGAVNLYDGIVISQSGSLAAVAQQNEFTRLTFQGDYPNSSTTGWDNALYINNVSFCTYDALLFNGNNAGTGLNLSGNQPSGLYSIVHSVSKCGFYGLNEGISYGGYTQGVTVDQCNFTNGNYGIIIPIGALNVDQFVVTNCQFNTELTQIVVQAPVGGMFITACLFIVAVGHAGVYVQYSNGAAGTAPVSTFIGNSFSVFTSGTAEYGIFFEDGSTTFNSVITGNIFEATLTAIYLGTATQQCYVQGNIYNTVTNKVINAGAGNSVGVATE